MWEKIFPTKTRRFFHDKAANLTEYRGDALSVVTACNERLRQCLQSMGSVMENFFVEKRL